MIGERRTRDLKRILIDDSEQMFGPDLTLSSGNPHVVQVQEKIRVKAKRPGEKGFQ